VSRARLNAARARWLAPACWLLATSLAHAAPRATLAPAAAEAAVDVEERLGARLAPELTFTGPDGSAVRLASLLGRGRPVVLVLAYYRCPMLCDLVLAGLSHRLRELGWRPGADYLGLTVSIDPKDTPAAARLKQHAVLQAIDQSGARAAAAWPFVVGDERAVSALAGAVGFRYAYDPRSGQFAHPAVAVVLTPEGRVSRYLYGVDFPLLDLRLALTEAARGQVGTIVDRLLLTCFRYDPSARRYGFYVSAVLKGGASAALLSVAVFLTALWRRDARRMRGAPRPPGARSS
jgi:protein SCO1/2